MAGYVQNVMSRLRLSAGASLVGFMQKGVGAVIRTIQDKLRETVSVKEWGAKCDGVTDDSDAVAAANLEAGKRALVFPGLVHLAKPTTITAVISDTGEQIFTAGSSVTIANGRNVRAAWFGAKPDGATEASAPIMRALTAARGAPTILDAGLPGYKTTAPIVFKGTRDGVRDNLVGAGAGATFILAYGAGPAIQSDQALADYAEVSGFTVLNKGAPGTKTGLDIGTARNCRFSDISVKGFLIAVALSKNIDAVGNYYNNLRDIVADCGDAPQGSIGFQLGNHLEGHANREGNANDVSHCRSYGCETGIWINGTGNTIKAHKIVSCVEQVTIVEGFDNDIEAYCESQTGIDQMGSAGPATVGNRLRLFNDALNLSAFIDNGWNVISGNTQAGGLGYPAPYRVLDSMIVDHINMQGKTGEWMPIFSINLPEVNAAVKVVITFCGYTFTVGNWAGIDEWRAYKKGSGMPAIERVTSSVDAGRVRAQSAADGTVTWSFRGDVDLNLFTTMQFTVSVQGVAADVQGFGAKIKYKRLA